MSRTTVLQIIAALITVAVMTVLYFVFSGFIERQNDDFLDGMFVGGAFVLAAFGVGLWMDRSAVRRRRQQQRSRDVIDL